MADDSDLVNQEEIERLLQSSAVRAAANPPARPASPGRPAGGPVGAGETRGALAQDSPSQRSSSSAISGSFQDSHATATAGQDDQDRVNQSEIDRMLGGNANPGDAVPKQAPGKAKHNRGRRKRTAAARYGAPIPSSRASPGLHR